MDSVLLNETLISLKEDSPPYSDTKSIISTMTGSTLRSLLSNVLYDKYSSLSVPMVIERMIYPEQDNIKHHIVDIYGIEIADVMKDVMLDAQGISDLVTYNYLNTRFNDALSNYPHWIMKLNRDNEDLSIIELTDEDKWISESFSEYDELVVTGINAYNKAQELYNIINDDDASEEDIEGELPDDEDFAMHMAEFMRTKMIPKRDIQHSSYLMASPDKVFGPLNNLLDQECANDKLDGCRMLSCTCDGEDWFDGTCDVCKKEIRDVSHSLRYPQEVGAWRGCFCSLGCMEEEMDTVNTQGGRMHFEMIEAAIDNVYIYDRIS